MPTTATRLERHLPATADDAVELRRQVTAFAVAHDASAALCSSIELAAAEALNNVVVHAYRDSEATGHIDLAAELLDDEVVVTIRDAGVGMGPRPDSPGCGFGIGLCNRLAEQVRISDLDPGTEVRLHFAWATS